MRCAVLLSCLGVPALFVPSEARAEHAEIRLVYERLAGAESCADPGELRAAIAERLGYDPFVDQEDVRSVVVRVSAVGSGMEATIERRGPSGELLGKPSIISSKTTHCDDLLATVAVGTAIAIDPLGTGLPTEPLMSGARGRRGSPHPRSTRSTACRGTGPGCSWIARRRSSTTA